MIEKCTLCFEQATKGASRVRRPRICSVIEELCRTFGGCGAERGCHVVFLMMARLKLKCKFRGLDFDSQPG